MGLGLAYAGTCKEEVQELLVPVVIDSDISMEVAGFAALSLGLVFASTQQEDCVQAMLQVRAASCAPKAEWGYMGVGGVGGSRWGPETIVRNSFAPRDQLAPARIRSQAAAAPLALLLLTVLAALVLTPGMVLLQALMTRSELELSEPFAKLICLALGLLFLGKQDAVDATLEVFQQYFV